MKDPINDLLSDWLDEAGGNPSSESDVITAEASRQVAESLMIHGLLADMSCHDVEHEATRISELMQRMDSHDTSDLETSPTGLNASRRRFTILKSALAIAAALMVMFVAFAPDRSASAAMASLERLVEAAAKPMDRSYSIHVAQEYPRDKRPRNLPPEALERIPKQQIDGAMLYVRGADQYVMTVKLSSGVIRTSGCDGSQSWAFREDGPVHVSSDLNRFRGGLPGWQQDIPFINIHQNLSQLRNGYEVELSGEIEETAEGAILSKLVAVRKSRNVRGPKLVDIWFDMDNGTIYRMLLDGLPRGGGGPKSVMIKLVEQAALPDQFFSHESHHEPGRRIKREESL